MPKPANVLIVRSTSARPPVDLRRAAHPSDRPAVWVERAARGTPRSVVLFLPYMLTCVHHIKEHRPDFNDRRIAGSAEARRTLRWTTKSKTKRTGHPPTWTDEQLRQAIAAYRAGEGTKAAIERRFGLPAYTI